jgi:hypothetical protein
MGAASIKLREGWLHDHWSGMKTAGHRIAVTGYASQQNILLVDSKGF